MDLVTSRLTYFGFFRIEADRRRGRSDLGSLNGIVWLTHWS